jgi:hypothetical protein
MNRTCGKYVPSKVSGESQVRERLALPVLVCAMTLALGVSGAVAAGPGATGREPQKLWRAYPLDSTRADSTARPAAEPSTPIVQPERIASTQPGRTAPASTRPARTAPASKHPAFTITDNSRSFPLSTMWLAIAVVLLAAGVVAVVVLRRMASSAHLPSARQGVGTRLALAAPRSVTASLLDSLPAPAEHRAEPTRAATDDVALKRKGPGADSAELAALRAKARPATHDIRVLKAKLAQPPRKPAEPARSEIEWWRGYVKSAFYARLRTPNGHESVIRSPPFRWDKPEPPPKTLLPVARAHAALVAQLQDEGWFPTGRGHYWYSLELQRRGSQTSRSPREGEA